MLWDVWSYIRFTISGIEKTFLEMKFHEETYFNHRLNTRATLSSQEVFKFLLTLKEPTDGTIFAAGDCYGSLLDLMRLVRLTVYFYF